jgi:hypothetical protein
MRHTSRSRILTIALLAPLGAVHAQTELSVFNTTGRAAATTFVTDYQTIGINPSNLGWTWRHTDKQVALGVAEGSYSLYSDALTRDDMRDRVLDANFRFTTDQKEEAARIFANAGAIADVNVMLVGAAFTTPNAGGFAFQIRDHARIASRFGPVAAELAFEGFRSDYFDLLVLATGDTVTNYATMSEDSLALIVLGIASEPQLLGRALDGSSIELTWYREYNFSYGRHLIRTDAVELYGGVGLKHLVGIGIVDIRAEDGELTGFTSLSEDFQLDYTTGSRVPGSRLSAGSLAFPRPTGRGFGVDLGLSLILKGVWKLGVAVTNLGSIKWTGNVFKATDGSLVDLATDGLDNYNFVEGLDDFATNSGFLEWSSGGERVVPLPTNTRLGVGRLFGETVEVGLDVIIPMNDQPGSLRTVAVGFGGDVRPMPWLQLSAGLMTGGNADTKLPVGVTFIAGAGTWEAGIASRDMITYFSQRNPTLSLSLGFLRFRI